MSRIFLFFALVLSLPRLVWAETLTRPEKEQVVAKPQQAVAQIVAPQADSTTLHYTEAELRRNQALTEQLLNQAIEQGNLPVMQSLLEIYSHFPQPDPLLILFAKAQIAKKQQQFPEAIRLYREILAQAPALTPVRVQLATTLFAAQHDNAAQDQFYKALSDKVLPADIQGLIQQHLTALAQRDRWHFSLSAQYLSEKNVNNAASDSYIENTAFRKNTAMLPQKARGIGYGLNLERDFNLFANHYLHLENNLYGKSYWNNHDFDEATNRFYLGYVQKSAEQRIALLPFYEQQWYSGHRYKRTNGARAEFNRWLSPQWQLSAALEYGQNFYANNPELNGNSKLMSSTLLWRPSPRYYFYAGGDVAAERSRVRHYGYDMQSLRLGWGQESAWGISSRVSGGFSQRNYKDNLILGRSFYFDQRRKDKIYSAHLTLWKRDWHWQGITPKLHFKWKKQSSNFATLYRYTDKSVNLLFEKTF